MKKYNILVFTLLTQIISSCNDNSNANNLFSFDTSQVKDQYLNSDKLIFALKNNENKQIDSITYFFNSKKVGTQIGAKKLSLT